MWKFLRRQKRFLLIAVDISLIILSSYLAFLIRFDGDEKILATQLQHFNKTLPLVIFLRIFFFIIFGLYKGLWRYASIQELLSIVKAVTFSTVAITAALYLILHHGYPRSIFIIDWLLTMALVGGFRFFIRILREFGRFRFEGENNTIIVGAGDAGEKLLREMLENPRLEYRPVGFVDDNYDKQNLAIHNVKVLGTTEDIPAIVKKYGITEIVIAIPSASAENMRRIINQCKLTRVRIKTVPSMSELINGQVNIQGIRKVNIRDLLSRQEINLDSEEIEHYIAGKKILITGAGGSIGSELSRQIARYHPGLLIFVGHGENSIYNIQSEFRERYKDIKIRSVIANIKDTSKINNILVKYRPEIIFHTAAYKHVPLMELNCDEAVKNNIFGSRNMMELADRNGIKDFIMISTDKAVNPTSVMGVTKRVAELIMQDMASRSSTRYVAVRFGNVLGSRGSVIPLFKKQIRAGGPVTVTHPEVTRYFMTSSEAAQLVLQAAASAKGGEIFILDMGSPIKIDELARNLITLSGLEPDVDIKIQYTGLRPGEKLHEELLTREEGISATRHQKIFVARPDVIDSKRLNRKLSQLEKACTQDLKKSGNFDHIINILKEIVPTYHPNRYPQKQKETFG